MSNAKAGQVAKQQAMGAGGGLPPEILADLREIYLQGVRADLAALDGLLEDLSTGRRGWADFVERVRRVVHNVKGQGSSFGYPLMTEIGESLHALLRQAPERASPAVRRVIEAHVACLHGVIDSDIDGDPGPEGRRLVERLRALTGRVAAEPGSALS
ncbi:MAG: Hpt domain-containing protein [Kiloniellales bacterium]|nr:Hpt domain-containing protein [Kiloniellales bacterium]